MKRTFLVFLLTLFLCGSSNAYNVGFDFAGSSNFDTISQMSFDPVVRGNSFSGRYERAIFSFQDSNGYFTETFTQSLGEVANIYGSTTDTSNSNLYIDLTLNGKAENIGGSTQVEFFSGSGFFYHDDLNNKVYDSGDDTLIGKLDYSYSQFDKLEGNYINDSIKMDIDIGFDLSDLNPSYWSAKDVNLANKTWLLSLVGSRIDQNGLWENIEKDGENYSMLGWDTSGTLATFRAVPEPSTMILLGLGLLGLAGIGRRKLKN